MKIFKYKKIMSLAISVLFLMSVVSICKYIDAHKNRVIDDSSKPTIALKKYGRRVGIVFGFKYIF